MSMYALLKNNSTPNMADVEEALQGQRLVACLPFYVALSHLKFILGLLDSDKNSQLISTRSHLFRCKTNKELKKVKTAMITLRK